MTRPTAGESCEFLLTLTLVLVYTVHSQPLILQTGKTHMHVRAPGEPHEYCKTTFSTSLLNKKSPFTNNK